MFDLDFVFSGVQGGVLPFGYGVRNVLFVVDKALLSGQGGDGRPIKLGGTVDMRGGVLVGTVVVIFKNNLSVFY